MGDISGSVYEFQQIKTKNFQIFRLDFAFTDDTVLTAAAQIHKKTLEILIPDLRSVVEAFYEKFLSGQGTEG